MINQTSRSLLILAGRLADGLGGASRADQAALVEAGRIRAVGQRETVRRQAAPDVEVVDLGAACLAPGLIDSHTHLSLAGDGRPYAEMFADTDEMMVLTGAMNMQRHLTAGITTIREHGARNRVGFTLKEGLARGYIPGPRMLVSGRPITCTGGHFHMCNEVADGEEEIRRSVRRLVHEGADYIKIMAAGGGTAGTIPGRASYETAELRAAVHEARSFGRLTAAHCRARESMLRAVEAGIDLMEHAEFLDPDDQLRFDPKIAEMMAESGIWVSPTLQAWTRYPRIVELRGRRDRVVEQGRERDLMGAFGGVACESLAGRGGVSPDEATELEALEARAELRLDVMRRMLDCGVRDRVVPGTDSGVGSLAFGHLDYDLQLLVRAGFTPGEALASATRLSAEAVGMGGEIGTVEPGKVADLVALDGDPTADVGAFSRVVAVFQAGRRIR